MKRKKIFSILILILILFSITACGNDTNGDSDRTLAKSESSVTNSDNKTDSKNATDAAVTSGKAIKAPSEEQVKQGKTIDKYQTSEVPVGKQKPIEPQKIDVNQKKQYECTVSITCKTILDNNDKLDPAKAEIIPKDGIISSEKKVKFYEGENVFDVLLRVTKDKGIHMEFVSTPMFNSSYIEGINNIYEYDCGELSGWMYKVNGWFPNYGCSRYVLKDGDSIEWMYTCDLGRDIGGDWAAQKEK